MKNHFLLLPKITFSLFVCMLSACNQTITSEKANLATNCFDKITTVKLPFTTNTSVDLEDQVELDSLCNTIRNVGNRSMMGIYGKIMVNDSVRGIIYLYAGDMYFPYLVTFKQEKVTDSLFLLNLPGGSTGEGENGTSRLFMKDNTHFTIIDTINTYTFDPERGGNIDSTKKTRVEVKEYFIDKNGKIILTKS